MFNKLMLDDMMGAEPPPSGPAGPAGTVGTVGTAGTAGTAGAAGAAGSHRCGPSLSCSVSSLPSVDVGVVDESEEAGALRSGGSGESDGSGGSGESDGNGG